MELEDLIASYWCFHFHRSSVTKYFAPGSLWISEDLQSPFPCNYSCRRLCMIVRNQVMMMLPFSIGLLGLLFPSYTSCLEPVKWSFRNMEAILIMFTNNILSNKYQFCFFPVSCISLYLLLVLLKTVILDVACILLISSEMWKHFLWGLFLLSLWAHPVPPHQYFLLHCLSKN